MLAPPPGLAPANMPETPPRHPGPACRPAPKAKKSLPQGFAWLVKLVPETAVYRSQLQFLFADPEMAALMAAAPAAIGRPLCSLCRVLGVLPPKILAPPAETRAPPAPKREAIREGADRRPEKPARTKRPPRVRYAFGLRYTPPFPNPA